MKFTYSKTEKLKSKTQIDLLFSEGKSVGVYPLRLVFTKISESENQNKFGVSVSKKYFKKAVDRNYFKRVLRELYRLNKQNLYQPNSGSYAIMFFYQTNQKLPFSEIEIKTNLLFQKWNNFIIEENKKELTDNNL